MCREGVSKTTIKIIYLLVWKTWLIQTPCYLELKAISLEVSFFQSFTISYAVSQTPVTSNSFMFPLAVQVSGILLYSRHQGVH